MKELICIVCPKGCHLKVDEENGWAVSGNSCPKGAEYGQNELRNPTRVLTTTVCVEGGLYPRIPVKTSRAIKAASISVFPDETHNALDQKTMSRVFEQMLKLSPSTNYGVIFGSHGTSWMPGNEVLGRSFGDDAGYNINIPEMADVLEGVFSGKQLDFILFDACMMATAEVCYEFKNVTDYLIGAVVETHVYGHPYDIIMPKLFAKDIPYSEVCKDYIDYSRELGAWGTCAAVDPRTV